MGRTAVDHPPGAAPGRPPGEDRGGGAGRDRDRRRAAHRDRPAGAADRVTWWRPTGPRPSAARPSATSPSPSTTPGRSGRPMTPDRPEAEIEAMSALFARHLPGLAARSVTRLGEGMDHVAYEADGGLILRMSKEPDPARRADRIRREAALLALVAEISPLPVPRVILSDPDAGVLGYVKLPGRPLAERPVAEPGRLAPALGEFLTRLHLAPPERFSALAAPDTQPLTAWLAEAERHHRAVAAHLPAAARRRIEAFLGGAPPAEPRALAFCHNDLGAEHVLAEGGTVTGVIDWSDAEIADPAYDLGLL